MAKKKSKRSKKSHASSKKVVSPQQKQKQAFARKVRFINKRISEIYDFFGEHSPEYEEIKNVVLTHFGITNIRNASTNLIQTFSPINFQTSKTFINLAYKDTNEVFLQLHESLKGRTVFQIVKEKYHDKIEGIQNSEEFEKNKRKISSSIKQTSILELDLLVKNLPSFYDALSQTDSFFQAEQRQKFAEYGHSKEESQAEEIMTAIKKYIQSKMVEGEKIKAGTPLLSEDEDYPFLQDYTPQLFNGNAEEDEPDWGNAVSKLKK